MFKTTTCPKLLRKYSPIWNTSKSTQRNLISTTSELPSIYELLYLNKPSEIHIEITRNTSVGTTFKLNVYFDDYLTTFNFANKNYYHAWLTLHHKNPNTSKYHEVAHTNLVSHELTCSLLRLLPKQLQASFRQILLIDNLPRKWASLTNSLSNIGPTSYNSVKVPTVVKLELLQAGAYPQQIQNSEKLIKTYYYFKE